VATYLTVSELAEAIRLHPRWIRPAIRRGEIRTLHNERDPVKARLTLRAWGDYVETLPQPYKKVRRWADSRGKHVTS
jgi:hypothetical protein